MNAIGTPSQAIFAMFIIIPHTVQQKPGPPDCCSRVFLTSNGSILEDNPVALGNYHKVGNSMNGKPCYIHKSGRFHLYYGVNTPRTTQPGWTVGTELGGQAFLYLSRDQKIDCPEEIQGIWDRTIKFDKTFQATCQNDKPKDCCKTVKAKSKGIIAGSQKDRLGNYVLSTEQSLVNNHPVYIKKEGKQMYLYMRQNGHRSDGWTISSQLDTGSLGVATRDTSSCPKGIQGGFIANKDDHKDESFSIKCAGKGDENGTHRPQGATALIVGITAFIKWTN